MTHDFSPTHRTTALRDRGRIRYDRAAAYAVLDEAYVAHVAFVVDGDPRVLPTLVARVGDTLYVHGSTGSRPMLAARGEGIPVCVEVTLLDGLVLAHSQFESSANYRSVIVHGRATLVTDPEVKHAALSAITDKIAAGRAADSRPGTPRELGATAVLALPLTEVSYKDRTGGVDEEEADRALPNWAGVLPVRQEFGEPEPAPGVTAPVPDYLRPARSPWLTAAPLRGAHVVLEPLDLSHAEGLMRTCTDPEVWAHLPTPAPRTEAEWVAYLTGRMRAYHDGAAVPWVQKDAVTGEIIGTTSYYDVNEAHRTLAIGHTFLGRRWWRTGVNTESKILLLTRAFEDLGAVRVEWHTDDRNVRSQNAIARLGATREAVLRRHRKRADGSWRDTVLYAMLDHEWPESRSNLRKRLRDRESATA